MRMKTLRVRDLMTDRVVALGPQDNLATLRALLYKHRIRHMPVVDDRRRLIGLVSHRDLLESSLYGGASPPEIPSPAILARSAVEEVMTTELHTVGPEDDIRRAAEIMLQRKLGCLPVVEGERLVGILTEADFVRFLARGD
jgi:CBS domain-containing membrane protein